MDMDFIVFKDSGEQLDRKSLLKAWLAYNGIKNRELSEKLDVHPSMISRIINGHRAPRHLVDKLIKIGIPEHLLPKPSRPRGRPPKCSKL